MISIRFMGRRATTVRAATSILTVTPILLEPIGRAGFFAMNKTTKRTLLALLLLLLLLLSAVGWAFWGGEDPQIAKIKEMRAQIEQAPREQQRELFGKMREEYQKLSPESREALFAERRQKWQERERKQMGEFFALSYAQQIAEIDKQIDDREKRRQRRAQNGAQNGGRGNGPPGGGGGSGGGGGPGGGGPGGGGGGPGNGRDTNDPNARRKSYLDHTTPLDRAQQQNYRQMVQQRRTQRGL
jgi:uncharacterized membrane protein YgcG